MHKQIKDSIKKRLIVERGDLFAKESIDEQEARAAATQILKDIVLKEHLTISDADQEKVIKELVVEFVGLGPIEAIFKDPSVTEIMINGAQKVYVEKNGKTMLSDIVFEDEQQLRRLIYKFLAPTRRRVDESFPYVDVSLKDGSRVNIVVFPIALDGSVITIRKFLKEIQLRGIL